MNRTVLLAVDVQTALINRHPYNEEKVLANIGELLAYCRDHGIEVVFVRHDGGRDDELAYGSDGWQIHGAAAPLEGEKIFDKRFNSAFRNTGLKEFLDAQNTSRIILVGLQTEYCIDATLKAAFEYGYDVVIPEDTTSTFDNSGISAKQLSDFYTEKIWNHRFAAVLSMDKVKSILSAG